MDKKRMAELSSEAVRSGMLRCSAHVIAERKPGVSMKLFYFATESDIVLRLFRYSASTNNRL